MLFLLFLLDLVLHFNLRFSLKIRVTRASLRSCLVAENNVGDTKLLFGAAAVTSQLVDVGVSPFLVSAGVRGRVRPLASAAPVGPEQEPCV